MLFIYCVTYNNCLCIVFFNSYFLFVSFKGIEVHATCCDEASRKHADALGADKGC